jgi:hypothetical protein
MVLVSLWILSLVKMCKGSFVGEVEKPPWTCDWSKRLCAKASGAILSQASKHDADHGDENPSFFTAGEDLVVLGKPTPRRKPGESAFDNPTVRKHMKTARSDLLPIDHGIFRSPDASQATPGVFDDLDVPAQLRLDPLAEAFLLVAAIGPDQLEPWKGLFERREPEPAAAVILDVGFMNQHVQDQSHGIDQQVF